MDIWLLVSYIGVLVVGGYGGYLFSNYVLTNAFANMLMNIELTDAQKATLMAELESNSDINSSGKSDGVKKLDVRIECINNIMYCYDKTTNQFVGQAPNKDELLEMLYSNFGPFSLDISTEDGADFLTQETKA